MKKMLVVFVVLLAVFCSTAFARYIRWTPAEKPPVSLRLALALAEAELEPEPVKYHCIGASLAKTSSAGDWELHFSSKEEKQIWISVGSDRMIRKSVEGFNFH